MLYCGTRIGVFYKHAIWAEKWVNDFLEKVDKSCIARSTKMSNGVSTIHLKDGTSIKTVYLGENSRGCKFDKVFVEPKVTQEEVAHIIYPTLTSNMVIEYE